ncbi:MAG: DUF4351 domain-containing protein, partial [Acidobacteriota bacterium]
RVEGRVEANEEIVLYFLQRQFGALDEEIKSAIHALSVECLTELSRAMFDFKLPDDLPLWLNSSDASREKRQ